MDKSENNTRQHCFPVFELESGQELQDVTVTYQTWGRLNARRDNVIVVGHTLTGNTAVDEWWPGLLGPGKALDTECYFVLCANVLGSCYGTTGPVSINPATGRSYGPDFPKVTVRDSVRLHKRLLDELAITGVELVIGGSLGGMQVLEWAFFGDFVRRLVPIAASGRHSAWCIGWSAAQRQAIYADPTWRNGWYTADSQPKSGLANARRIAMLTYRSQPSFEQRFGRAKQNGNDRFAVESYLNYQGEKIIRRFDANAYIYLTVAMDTHDISRQRGEYADVLRSIKQSTLVVGIDSDILYPLSEQEEQVRLIPDSQLRVLVSPHGHDAFLIEQQQLNLIIINWMKEQINESVEIRRVFAGNCVANC